MQNDITKAIIQIAESAGLNIKIYSEDDGLLYNGANIKAASETTVTMSPEYYREIQVLATQKKPQMYYVLSITVEDVKYLTELLDHLVAIAEDNDLVMAHSDNTAVYIKTIGKKRDYRSAGEFAHTLYENLSGDTKIKFSIGVGGIALTIDEIPLIIDRGVTAYRFGMLIDPENHVYSYKEYALLKIFDGMQSEALTNYFKMLSEPQTLELFEDAEMARTADVFLKKSLNLSEAARLLYLHRNTLIYRLDKIEDMTGLNIRYFSDAVIFRMMTILSKLKDK